MFSLRRLLLVLACLTVALAVVAPAALVWSALYTTSGLQFLIGHIPHRMAGVRLDIAGVSGTVAEGLRVERSEERRVGKECRSRWSPYH